MKDRSQDMTLRDIFACFALEGMIANKGFKDRGARGRAADAYMAADGMLEARKSSKEVLIEQKNEEAIRLHAQEVEAHKKKVELMRRVFNNNRRFRRPPR